MKIKKELERGEKIKNEYIISAILSFVFKSLPLFSNPYTHKNFIRRVIERSEIVTKNIKNMWNKTITLSTRKRKK